MKNSEFLIGKTIESIIYNNSNDEDEIVLKFTDSTSAFIKTNASNQLYYMYIENRE